MSDGRRIALAAAPRLEPKLVSAQSASSAFIIEPEQSPRSRLIVRSGWDRSRMGEYYIPPNTGTPETGQSSGSLAEECWLQSRDRRAARIRPSARAHRRVRRNEAHYPKHKLIDYPQIDRNGIRRRHQCVTAFDETIYQLSDSNRQRRIRVAAGR